MTSPAKNGGPAFARPMGAMAGRYNPSQEGMSMRAWFATHAPADIPEWFAHTPATKRPVVPVPHAELSDEQYKEFEGLGDWLEAQDVRPEVVAFHERYIAVRDAAFKWDAEQVVARYFAWRWFYADMMLKGMEGQL